MQKLPPFVRNLLFALPVLAAAALAAAHLGDTEGRGWVLLPYAGRGWELLHGINEPGISYSMPLLSVLMTLVDFDPARLISAVSAALFLIVLLAYNLGRLRNGGAGGLIYALAAAAVSLALPAPHDPEQVFFTLLILLYLNLEAAREAAPGALASLLSGLALGVTLLVRSTLFLLPPLMALLQLARGARPRKVILKEAAVFLLGAYMLLLPWARLNHFVYGKFTPFEVGRADSNVITGVLGSVYTMEGNPRALAGLDQDDNALAWAVRQVAASPLAYISATAKRVWHILLIYPLLALLAALALLYLRKSAPPGPAALTLYFIAVHSLMSIEIRYFYPLAYLLGLLAAGGICAGVKTAAAPAGSGIRTARLLLLPALLAALAVEYVVLAYPSKAGRDCLSGVEAALEKNPEHPWLLYKKGEYLVTQLRTEEGLAALRASARLAGGRQYSNAADILRMMDSFRPETVRAEFIGSYFGEDLLRGLRQLELGQREEAARSLAAEYARWNKDLNTLRGTPYGGDQAIQERLRVSNPDFQDRLLYEALLYWPARRRLIVLDRLAGLLPPSLKLQGLKFLSLPSESAAGRSAITSLAATPGLLAALEPAAGRAAAAQLAMAAIPLRQGGFSRVPGPGAAALALFENRDAGLALAKTGPDRRQYSQEELLLLAGAVSGDKAKAAKLAELRPLDPLCLALASAGGKAGEQPLLLLDGAEIYLGLGDKGKAALLAGAAGALARDPDPLRRSALLLQGAGRYAEALTAISKAAGAAPGDGDILNDRGVLLMLLKRDEEAEKDFTNALKENWQAGLNLAALRLRAGRRAEAEELYRLALARSDLPPPVRSRLERDLEKFSR